MTDAKTQLEANKALVRRYTHEVFERQNYGVIDEVLADDVVSHNPALPTEITNPAEFRESVELIHAAFPDFEASIEDIVAEGDRVVTRTREGGTHEGAFAGIEPTGRSVEIQGLNLYRIKDGEIAEMWIQVDQPGLLEQVGVA